VELIPILCIYLDVTSLKIRITYFLKDFPVTVHAVTEVVRQLLIVVQVMTEHWAASVVFLVDKVTLLQL